MPLLFTGKCEIVSTLLLVQKIPFCLLVSDKLGASLSGLESDISKMHPHFQLPDRKGERTSSVGSSLQGRILTPARSKVLLRFCVC